MSCRRYFFHIAFKGTAYRGWQIQAEALNIQGIVANAFGQVLKEKISIMGCGRTDALVHASQFFFHADIEREWDFDLLFRLNKILPDDIAIYDIIPMHENAHARYDARQRTYDYFMHFYKDPFLAGSSSLYLSRALNVDEMSKAAALLPLYNNYFSFCTSPMRHRTTIVHVTSATLWMEASGKRMRFQISANRFLSAMVRIVVGKLLEVGNGNMSLEAFEHMLRDQPVQKTIEPAYPQGLFLSSVKYPYLNMQSNVDFFPVGSGSMDWIQHS